MTTIVIFSDLDGTLLDEETYSPESSVFALKRLQALGTRIILCSSKTRQEQEEIRTLLGIRGPFIVENGSAIIIPPDTASVNDGTEGTKVLVLGKLIDEVLRSLIQVRVTTGLRFEGFHDVSTAEVSQVTGLNLKAAKLAQVREYSETIITKFTKQQLALFSQGCARHGLHFIQGGRFLNVVGEGVNKGVAVSLLIEHLKSQFDDVITFGIGDSKNDETMLRAVDHPFLVQRPHGKWETLDIHDLNYISAIGPLGFVNAAEYIERRWLVDAAGE